MKRLIDNDVVETDAVPDLPHGGRGVFETLLWRDDALVFWRQHWLRFKLGCAALGLELPADPGDIAVHACELAAANQVTTGVARVATWRSASAADAVGEAARGRAHWRLEVTPPRPHMAKPEFTVAIGPVIPPASADRAFKHLDRTQWIETLHAVRAAGLDEALLFDPAGHLVEGCGSNVFFVRDAVLHTPELAVGPLPGVMRAEVIALARASGWDVREGRWTAADIEAATEIWLTNSLIGVRPIATLAGRALPEERPILDAFCVHWDAQYGWDPAAPVGR